MTDSWVKEKIKDCEEATQTIARMTVLEVIYSNKDTILCPRFKTGEERAEIRFVGPAHLMRRLYDAMKGMDQG